MASQGPLSCGTTATGSGTALGYGVSLTNPDNMKVSDNIYATYLSLTNVLTWQGTNFGFSIPTGVTIDGIFFEIERRSPAGASSPAVDFIVSCVKANGSVGSANKATGATWATTDTYNSFGGASDLWSESWTAADINNSNFGIVFSGGPYEGDVYIDHIRCTVYYTAGSSANTGFFSLF